MLYWPIRCPILLLSIPTNPYFNVLPEQHLTPMFTRYCFVSWMVVSRFLYPLKMFTTIIGWKLKLCLFGAQNNIFVGRIHLLKIFICFTLSWQSHTVRHCPSKIYNLVIYPAQGWRENQARRQGDFVPRRSSSQTFDIELGVGGHGCVHVCCEVRVRRHQVLDGVVCVRHETGHRFVSTTSNIRRGSCS